MAPAAALPADDGSSDGDECEGRRKPWYDDPRTVCRRALDADYPAPVDHDVEREGRRPSRWEFWSYEWKWRG